ncbi:MAG: transposase, partial [Verrucomicrobiales bacterium]|nr:transposase [Verrucomicrobiales bacterium]
MNNEPEPKVRKKRYDENFKRSAVEHWLGSGKSANQVATELGINAQTLKIWKQLAVMPPGSSAPRTVEALEAENRRLRREMTGLIRQREILKKTLGILSTPSDNG